MNRVDATGPGMSLALQRLLAPQQPQTGASGAKTFHTDAWRTAPGGQTDVQVAGWALAAPWATLMLGRAALEAIGAGLIAWKALDPSQTARREQVLESLGRRLQAVMPGLPGGDRLGALLRQQVPGLMRASGDDPRVAARQLYRELQRGEPRGQQGGAAGRRTDGEVGLDRPPASRGHRPAASARPPQPAPPPRPVPVASVERSERDRVDLERLHRELSSQHVQWQRSPRAFTETQIHAGGRRVPDALQRRLDALGVRPGVAAAHPQELAGLRDLARRLDDAALRFTAHQVIAGRERLAPAALQALRRLVMDRLQGGDRRGGGDAALVQELAAKPARGAEVTHTRGPGAPHGETAGDVNRRQLERDAARLERARSAHWRERRQALPGADPEHAVEATARRHGVSGTTLRRELQSGRLQPPFGNASGPIGGPSGGAGAATPAGAQQSAASPKTAAAIRPGPFLLPPSGPPALPTDDPRSRYRMGGAGTPPAPPGSSMNPTSGAPSPSITARHGLEGLVPPPAHSGTVQRNGIQLSLSLGGHLVAARIWRQTGDGVPPHLPLPPSSVEVFDPGSALDSVAQLLADRLPPGLAWRVMHVPPLPLSVATAAGIERLSSIAVRIGDAVASGAVLYDPTTGQLRLNLRDTPEGPSLVAPLDMDVVEARGVAPTELRGLPRLPLHPIASTEVLKSWHLRLSGPIDAQLAAAITRGLNQKPFGREFWWLPGADPDVAAKARIRFALPGTFPIGGVFRLPKGWPGLSDGLLPAQAPPDQSMNVDTPALPPADRRKLPRATGRQGLAYGLKPAPVPPDRSTPVDRPTRPPPDEVIPSRWGGFSVGLEWLRIGVQAFSQRVKSDPAPEPAWPYLWPDGVAPRPATADPARLHLWPQGVLRAPEAHGRPLPTRLFLPAIGAEVPSRIQPLPSEPGTDNDDAVARVEARAEFTLVFPGPEAPTIRISGSVLNALHGYPLQASDLPALGRFLRSLDPSAVQRGDAQHRDVAPVLSFNAAVVFEAMQAFEPGQSLPPEVVRRLWGAIETFARSLPSRPGQFNLPGP